MGSFSSGYTLIDPTKMTFGPDGLIYVSQWNPQPAKIVRFDGITGEFVDEFTDRAIPQAMGHAWDDEGNLYVLSFQRATVERFDPEGNFIDVFIAGNGLQGPVNLWFGEGGDLFVVDWVTGTIKRYDGETGAFIEDFVTGLGNAEGVTVGPDGHLYVCDWQRNRVNQYDAETGRFLKRFIDTGAGGLVNPNSIAFAPEVEE